MPKDRIFSAELISFFVAFDLLMAFDPGHTGVSTYKGNAQAGSFPFPATADYIIIAISLRVQCGRHIQFIVLYLLPVLNTKSYDGIQ